MWPPDLVRRNICDFWLIRRCAFGYGLADRRKEAAAVQTEPRPNRTRLRLRLRSQRRLRLDSTLPPGKTPAWWTADERWVLWRMRGKHREPTEGSIVCRWPVRNSIIPPSHPRLPLALSTTAAGRGSSTNNIISAHWTRGLIQSLTSYRNTSQVSVALGKSLHSGFNTGWNWTPFKSINPSVSPTADVKKLPKLPKWCPAWSKK